MVQRRMFKRQHRDRKILLDLYVNYKLENVNWQCDVSKVSVTITHDPYRTLDIRTSYVKITRNLTFDCNVISKLHALTEFMTRSNFGVVNLSSYILELEILEELDDFDRSFVHATEDYVAYFRRISRNFYRYLLENSYEREICRAGLRDCEFNDFYSRILASCVFILFQWQL